MNNIILNENQNFNKAFIFCNIQGHCSDTGGHTFFSGCVDGPWEFWVGLCSFGSDDNIGTILGSFKGNRFPDASACPCDEQGATSQLSESKTTVLLSLCSSLEIVLHRNFCRLGVHKTF